MTKLQESSNLIDWAVEHPAALIVGASVIALGAAYGSQIFGGLAPCILCLYQRVPYAIVIVLGLAALILKSQGRADLAAISVPLAGVVFFVGAVIAGFHVGVEQHWWQGTTECVGPAGAATLQDLEAQILATPVTLCNEIAWSLFGLSMAGYNVIASLALSGFCFYATLKSGSK